MLNLKFLLKLKDFKYGMGFFLLQCEGFPQSFGGQIKLNTQIYVFLFVLFIFCFNYTIFIFHLNFFFFVFSFMFCCTFLSAESGAEAKGGRRKKGRVETSPRKCKEVGLVGWDAQKAMGWDQFKQLFIFFLLFFVYEGILRPFLQQILRHFFAHF